MPQCHPQCGYADEDDDDGDDNKSDEDCDSDKNDDMITITTKNLQPL